MAAATLLDGPAPGISYTGRIDTGGFSPNAQWGRAAFPTTDTTCTIPLKDGGIGGLPLVFTNLNIIDKTLTYSITGTTITFTRSGTDSNARFNYLIFYLG